MLAVHDPDSLRRAVAQEDLVALTKVPGIGRKGAQRLVLELKDRLGPPRGSSRTLDANPADNGAHHGWESQVHAALLALGWSTRDADDAVSVVAGEASDDLAADARPDVPALLKAALRTLSRA